MDNNNNESMMVLVSSNPNVVEMLQSDNDDEEFLLLELDNGISCWEFVDRNELDDDTLDIHFYEEDDVDSGENTQHVSLHHHQSSSNSVCDSIGVVAVPEPQIGNTSEVCDRLGFLESLDYNDVGIESVKCLITTVPTEEGDCFGDRSGLGLGLGFEDEEEEEEEDGDEDEDGYDLDDELVPRSVRDKFGRQRIRKLGKRGFARMYNSKRSPYLFMKPGCVHGKHGLGLKHCC